MLFGFFICLDAFMFIFTFLPLRLLLAMVSIVYRFFTFSKYVCVVNTSILSYTVLWEGCGRDQGLLVRYIDLTEECVEPLVLSQLIKEVA